MKNASSLRALSKIFRGYCLTSQLPDMVGKQRAHQKSSLRKSEVYSNFEKLQHSPGNRMIGGHVHAQECGHAQEIPEKALRFYPWKKPEALASRK